MYPTRERFYVPWANNPSKYPISGPGSGGEILEAVCGLVKQKLEQYPASSKIVVYGGGVLQTVEIGDALECPIYHRSVDYRAGKARRMKELMEGKSRVIAATNALGMGVDLPDIS